MEKKDKSNGFHTLTHNLKTTTDTAMKLCMYIKLSVKYICSSICLQNLHFSQQKKDVYAKENMVQQYHLYHP